MLAIGRALMTEPKLLLLDEPSLGLAPMLVDEIVDIIKRINREGKVAVLLVEQNAAMALDIVDHAYLMDSGRIVMSGPAEVVKANPGRRGGVSRRRSRRGLSRRQTLPPAPALAGVRKYIARRSDPAVRFFDLGSIDRAGRRLRHRFDELDIFWTLVARDPSADEIDDLLRRRTLSSFKVHTALIASPHCASGTPSTTTSAIAGCAAISRSTSAG